MAIIIGVVISLALIIITDIMRGHLNHYDAPSSWKSEDEVIKIIRDNYLKHHSR